MTPDRVALLEFVTDFRIGGTERQVVNLATRLDPARFDIRMACFRRLGQFLGEVEARGMPLSTYTIGTLLSLRAVGEQLRLARDIRRSDVHLVHSYGFYPNVFAVPAARMAGAPAVVASIRDTGDHLSPRQRRVQAWVCRWADRVVVNAEAVRQRLVEDGYDASRIRVIPNGIALERFKVRRAGALLRDEVGFPPGAPIVAVLARLTEMKGVEYFLDAARLLGPWRPEARFLVVGDGLPPYRRALERRAELLGLGGRVAFTGFRSDVPEILSEVAVSVLPSLSEGLSNVVLESMAAGAPVVATRVGGNAEMVEDGVTGLLVPPRDAYALAGAVGRLLRDRAVAERLGRAGKARVARHFSVEAMVSATEGLYEGLLRDVLQRGRRRRFPARRLAGLRGAA